MRRHIVGAFGGVAIQPVVFRSDPAEELIQVDARRIGLISDTHGLLRPDVFTAFTDVELILHAGDVGGVTLRVEGVGALVRIELDECACVDELRGEPVPLLFRAVSAGALTRTLQPLTSE